MKKNGSIGPLLNFVEVAAILRKDVRTVRRWAADGEHPELTVRVGGQTYVRRSMLERLIGGPIDTAAAPRVTIVAPNGVMERVPADVAHELMRYGAKIPDNDELSQKNYDAWLEQQRAAEVTS